MFLSKFRGEEVEPVKPPPDYGPEKNRLDTLANLGHGLFPRRKIYHATLHYRDRGLVGRHSCPRRTEMKGVDGASPAWLGPAGARIRGHLIAPAEMINDKNYTG